MYLSQALSCDTYIGAITSCTQSVMTNGSLRSIPLESPKAKETVLSAGSRRKRIDLSDLDGFAQNFFNNLRGF